MSGQVLVRSDIDTRISEIKAILPPSVSIDAFNRAANIAIAQTPGLAEADAESLFNSLSKCAADGLVPDGREAALVVFNKNIGTKQQPNWVKAAQYMPMVDGVLKRARMSGQVSSIAAKVVCDGDTFQYWIDEDGEHFKHIPAFGSRGDLKLVYAYARMTSGELIMEVMDKADIDRVKAASKGGDYGPWKEWYDRMALKSVLHRLARRLPNASEMVQMLEIGNQMNFDNKQEAPKQEIEINPYARLAEIISTRGSDESKMLEWAGKGVKREIASFEELSEQEAAAIVKKLEAQA